MNANEQNARAGFDSYALLFKLVFAQTESHASAPQSRLIVGYLAQFRLDTYPLKEIETRGAADRLTHILYAFCGMSAIARPHQTMRETDYLRVVHRA